MKSVFYLLICLLLLSTCNTHSTVITGQFHEAVESNDVTVHYGNRPNCEFEVVAHMQIPGDFYTVSSLVEKFQHKAARLGASAVEIDFIQKIGATEYLGSARAIRCLD